MDDLESARARLAAHEVVLGRGGVLGFLAAALVFAAWSFEVLQWIALIAIPTIVALVLLGSLSVTLGRRARRKLDELARAEQDLASALASTSFEWIALMREDLQEASTHNALIRQLYDSFGDEIGLHFERVFEVEIAQARRQAIISQCHEAYEAVSCQIEERRVASPAVRAERELSEAIANLRQIKSDADKLLDEQRARKKLKWWFDLNRPNFAEIDEKVEQLEAAKEKLSKSGDITRTNEYYRKLNSLVISRTSQVQRAAAASIPTSRHQAFDSEKITQNALILSALSVPISAWQDITQAGSIYDSLRSVNGNFADMSDAEIWLETLTMSGSQLAGLASLTKGALFEDHVADQFGGELFEPFNHPDTDIVIDGVEYQIKATDSAAYIESVPEDIEVISTSAVAAVTGSIDGGLTNVEITESIDLALGGTMIDMGDTALDAVLTGIGGVGLFSLLTGVRHASTKYKETGDIDKAVIAGGTAVVRGTASSVVNVSEIAVKGTVGIVTSKPARFAGRLVGAGFRKIGQKIEEAERESVRTASLEARRGSKNG
ncbi:hypothetical protein [Erythrobacter sp. SD-21]|uniref:hypothetical protein n=1 Tax=Erythrobacter sp. SD-21 TaxID=161528 RepID=UPI000153F1BD|nr:hypothetical protein [Erythrobacter sp. SD-21]EDL48259.1 hypothetical protein ED21_31949 [Erythrobacter sp. SD-21]